MSPARVLSLLRRYESRNVTFVEADGSWPVVWARAQGVHVWDADGRRYLDLTAAFGVAAAGHANPRVVRAGQRQMARLAHAMGDVHPHEGKAQLARELSRLTFERWTRSGQRSGLPLSTGKTIFCSSGFEAVEAALKTARLATHRREIIAFEGGYHGAGYGALNATHRDFFRRPFQDQLGGFGHFAPFPAAPDDLEPLAVRLERLLRRRPIGAILVEPVQGRGGIRVPPPGFLPRLRELCDAHGALLILDEIYTGFGRTGRWFACEHSGVAPDVICLGKALTGGFPLSACVGRADLMDAAWPVSAGEALHTSTFLGHPVGCAMALAQIREIARLDLVRRSERLGRRLLEMLQTAAREPATLPKDELRESQTSSERARIRGTRGACASQPPIQLAARGLGLMAGVELRNADGSPATHAALRVIKAMLQRGFILLPEGADANVISLTPPLTITERQLRDTVTALAECLGDL
jgi:4-aminobutyrate aminotransferase/(S)-3-amino-2-methylpropionate transaminase